MIKGMFDGVLSDAVRNGRNIAREEIEGGGTKRWKYCGNCKAFKRVEFDGDFDICVVCKLPVETEEEALLAWEREERDKEAALGF